jgi:hypothetical protein
VATQVRLAGGLLRDWLSGVRRPLAVVVVTVLAGGAAGVTGAWSDGASRSGTSLPPGAPGPSTVAAERVVPGSTVAPSAASTGVPVPGPVTGLAATDVDAGGGTARLCWQRAQGADLYALDYRDVTSGTPDWTRMPYPIAGLCYTTKLLLTGHTYEFRIVGSNSGGVGPPSNIVTAALRLAPPGPVTALVATDVGPYSAHLCWRAAPGANAYSLDYRDVTSGTVAWTRMPYPITDGLCYTTKLLVTGDTYDFRVVGANSGGIGPPSNVVTVTTHA